MKWKQELIRKGKWRGQIPPHLQINRGSQPLFQHRHNSANVQGNDPDIEELNEAMKLMNTCADDEQPTVFHTDYFCSNKEIIAKVPSNEYGLADTGSSHHIFNHLKHFDSKSLTDNTDPTKRLNLAGGSDTLALEKIGTAYLLDVDGKFMAFENSLYVPKLNKNLIAASTLIKRGVMPVVHPSHPNIFSLKLNNRTLFKGFFSGNLMLIKLIEQSVRPTKNLVCSSTSNIKTDSILKLHHRLAHPNFAYLKRMIKEGMITGVSDNCDLSLPPDCVSCMKSKGQRLTFKHNRPRAIHKLENVHVDLRGIIRNTTVNDISYYMLFTYDYTGMKFIYFLKFKDKAPVFAAFEAFLAFAERQSNRKLECLTLDQGSVFFNSTFLPYCREKGIWLHETAPYAPEQNGVSERANKTVISKARAIIQHANIPINLCFEAVNTVIYLDNQTLSLSYNEGKKTPFEARTGRKPSISHIKIFGCAVEYIIRKSQRDTKFSQVTKSGVFLGYTPDNFNYRILDRSTGKILTSHEVYFREHIFPFHDSNPNNYDRILYELNEESDPIQDTMVLIKITI